MPKEGRSYRRRSRSSSDRDSPERDRRKRPARRRSRSRSKDRSSRSRRSPVSQSSRRERSRRERSRRSRSREHRRSRSRSRDRKRRRTRSRSRSASPDRRKSDRRTETTSAPAAAATHDQENNSAFDPTTMDKEAEQQRLELEMKKRRERIEKWRADRKVKEMAQAKKELEKGTLLENLQIPKKKWNLDEDGSDDEEPKRTTGVTSDQSKDTVEVKKEEEEEEVDPLDAFMQGVHEEVRKIKSGRSGSAAAGGTPSATGSSTTGSGTVVIKAVKTRAVAGEESKTKGELMEQDQDGLEYSEEEPEMDIHEANERLAQKGKKELMKIDHNKIVYQPFRKNFWVEVPELKAMTPADVEAYRAELEGIKVKGKDVPKPIKTWSQAGLSKKVMDVLKKNDYEKPTPIQAQGIPVILSGRDMIGVAKTGSGKTLAFVLPMMRHIADQHELEDTDGPIAIIMAPTRELCLQIGKECRKFAKPLGLRAVCVYGGTGISEQIAELKRGAEIIVCTPGRMIDMLAANSGRVTNLVRVTYIVLDEADRMFDMGFEPQVMRIIDNVRPDRQCVLFSATFPRQMEALARRILIKPVEVQVGGKSIVCKDVEQHVILLDESQKFFKLLELLGKSDQQESTLIFVDKQESADDLLKDLMKAMYPCMALHGGIDQFDRDSTINDFKSGKINLLIATSVAARGLDVKHLTLVVNYDCPNHYEDYVHRCGRTGRAGNKGRAYTFLTEDNARQAGDIIKALELSESNVPTDLKQLWEQYRQQQSAEGKKVRTGGGFGGRGFKFDENEAQTTTDRKRFEKAALGLQDSDDDDLNDDMDSKIESMLAPKRSVKEVNKPPLLTPVSSTAASTPTSAAAAAAAAGAGLLGPVPTQPSPAAMGAAMNVPLAPGMAPAMPGLLGPPPGVAPPGAPPFSVPPPLAAGGATPSGIPGLMSTSPFAGASGSDKLELARKLALKINAQKQLSSNAAAIAVSVASGVGGGAGVVRPGGDGLLGRPGQTPVLTARMVAEQLAAKLNTRLNYIPEEKTEEEPEPEEPVFTKYEEELEINDFPQHTRWKVTSKEALAQISEYSEAGITVRGTYYAPGTKVPEGERKLFLAIESASELAVSKAKAEITRLIKEELVRAQTQHAVGNRGRYKVL
ncbi:probable ATP-dependent RNA helicase DDX46 isoform X2 [Amphibalanus amphitrite]|uniref:probable ATP-dependent RNA helicase DDX46 isoform X2 n=1 Tax=Amphibalanus amphitrite TaxID=1232801 RepID=UPI001C924584|nr:probable ATP-dependent RNA helicase DDX46 isoform X2 [Amphibalanus amphitrite]XP_043202479.1 probable ATP-dependent RNA helicase DDX46 isoform X2 [Amphibalanus amphitrite]